MSGRLVKSSPQLPHLRALLVSGLELRLTCSTPSSWMVSWLMSSPSSAAVRERTEPSVTVSSVMVPVSSAVYILVPPWAPSPSGST